MELKNSPIKIIVCDDHPLITEGLLSYIENKAGFEIMATASSASTLRELLTEKQPEILLLDVNLPDANGIDLCQEIKRQYPQVKIIGLSNFNEHSVITRMIRSGACGYLVKSSPLDTLLHAIKEVALGNVYFGKEAQSILDSTSSNKEGLPPITRREKEVLKYLHKGLSSPQIAEKMCISAQTVDSHRKSLMQKFGVNKTIPLLQQAEQLGFL